MKKLNRLYTLITATTLILVVSIFIGLNARGGGGHGGGGHGGGGHGRGGHGGHYSHGGHGHGGRGRGGWGRGGYGYGGWSGFGYGLGLGFALGYPGYWSNGYYYNSAPIIIDNTSYSPGQACWNDDMQQWVLCANISINQ